MIPTALTIAGSDPSGGAGIQADLKTFSTLKVYGMSVIAALTVQNTRGVLNSMDVPADFVGEQLDAVISDIRPTAVKTGMLGRSDVVDIVASRIRKYGISNLIVDPVVYSTSGSALLKDDALDVLRRRLLPLALVVTPNLPEAQLLTGRTIQTVGDMEEAALDIHGFGAKHVLIKGGHMDGPPTDVFFDGDQFERLERDRIDTNDTHGTGCVLAAALTAYLARGESVKSAVHLSKDFVTTAIRNSLRLGSGRGPCDPVGLL